MNRWYASLRRHGRPRRREQLSPPYGVRHTRQPGEPFTVCAQGPWGWIFFWHLPFAPDAPETCQRCSELLLLQRSWNASSP